MWNWYVSALAVGSSIVCYDGSPLVPHINVLWDLVDKLKLEVLCIFFFIFFLMYTKNCCICCGYYTCLMTTLVKSSIIKLQTVVFIVIGYLKYDICCHIIL